MYRLAPYSSLPPLYTPPPPSINNPPLSFQPPPPIQHSTPPPLSYLLSSNPPPPTSHRLSPTSYCPPPSFLHHNENFVPASQEGGKRLFPNRNTEIQSVINNPNEKKSLPLNLPRSLETKDIPGGQPGTLQSKVVKNKEIAKKLIEEQQKKTYFDDDSLTQFQQEFNESMQYGPIQSNEKQKPSNSFHSYRENIKNKEEDNGRKNLMKGDWEKEENRRKDDENLRKEEGNGRNEDETRKSKERKEEQNEEGEIIEREVGKEEDDVEFENFKRNYFNFYRGYTPNEKSTRMYSSAIQILKAYENIKDELDNINKEREQAILNDPDFHKNASNFFAFSNSLPNSNPKSSILRNSFNIIKPPPSSNPLLPSSRPPLPSSQPPSSNSPPFFKNNHPLSSLPPPPSSLNPPAPSLALPTSLPPPSSYLSIPSKPSPPPPSDFHMIKGKLNPTYLSFAGNGVLANNAKYKLDIIGNVIKEKRIEEEGFKTFEGVKRFGAGLKNFY